MQPQIKTVTGRNIELNYLEAKLKPEGIRMCGETIGIGRGQKLHDEELVKGIERRNHNSPGLDGPDSRSSRTIALLLALFVTLVIPTPSSQAACTGCTQFENGRSLGSVVSDALTEASGIAASRRNYTVLWTHNDGSQGRVYALTTNGVRLATFDLTKNVDDVEDIAVGPGPMSGVHYLYVGDIGGNVGTNETRPDIKLVRLPEPFVDLAWAANGRSLDFDDVDTFTLVYPDGRYDAETLMVDPLTSDVFVGTKQDGVTRIYRANVNNATNRQIVTLEFVRSVSFSQASAGDISPDGTQIILRREGAARLWQRCDGESIDNAFSRSGTTVPVFGPPIEPNGEGMAFFADGSGYVTIGETNHPGLFFFQATCPRPPAFMIAPTNQSALMGGTVRFISAASGFPAPSYTWRFSGQIIVGQTGPTLTLNNVTSGNAGVYQVTASNVSGVISASATLTIRDKPDLRVTEVMSSAASSPGVENADWWELTSFEPGPVSIGGWRFNDNGGGLTDPFALPGGLVIGPNESIVFVEGLTAAEFQVWWGATNLPSDLQIVRYTGTGLSLGAGGDGLRLWDNITANANDTVTSVDFGTATEGVSFNYDPNTQVFGGLSQLGINGVIRASLTTDIGSPGRIFPPAARPQLTILLLDDRVRIEFSAMTGHQYALEVSETLLSGSWSATGDVFQATASGPAFFEKELAAGNRFYRIGVD